MRNNNQAVTRKIASGSIRSHTLRNLMAVLAITLTTLLITTVFTVGIGFYDAIKLGTEITPGPLSDGGVIAPLSAYEELLGLEEVDWAAYVRRCNIGTLHNREMIGIQAELLAPNAEYYARNSIMLLAGSFPRLADEITVSDTMAERLGIGITTGASYTLKPMILEDGEQVEKEIPVTIVGVTTSPLAPLSGTYEEIYTAESFLLAYAPEMEQDDVIFYIGLTEREKARSSIPTLMETIRDQVGGSGVTYLIPMGIPPLLVTIVAVFVALIMICGYLLIYNVFYISIASDIRFFGMLKTIGTTGKQIRAILAWQTARLTLPGVLLGLILGYIVGMGTAPAVVAYTDYGDYYRASACPLVFLASVLFSTVTVLLSCRKPFRMATRISPIEAAKFSERGGKHKKLLSILSLAFSGVIFLVAFTVTMGYNVESKVEQQNSADVRIWNNTMLYGSPENYQPISERMLEEFNTLPFVQEVTLYYEARQVERDESGSDAADGQIKMTEAFRAEFDRSVERGTGWMSETETGDIQLKISGFPPHELHREEAHIGVLDGSWDEEKFASGGYVIYNQGSYQTEKVFDDGIHAGDKPVLSIYDPDMRQYAEREMEVLAVVERSEPYPTGILARTALSFSSEDFRDVYPLADKMIGTVQIDAAGGLTAEQYGQVEAIVQGSFNPQLRINSRYSDRIQYQSDKQSMILLGLFLSVVFGVIGISNVVNTQVNDILSRKLGFATLRAVGMTKRQMERSILRENLTLCLLSVILALLLSIVLIPRLSELVIGLNGFSPLMLVLGCGILLAVMLAVSMSIAAVMTRFLNRVSVMEQLREGD